MITLGNDPFSAEHYSRFADVSDALDGILSGDTSLYLDYWLNRVYEIEAKDATEGQLQEANRASVVFANLHNSIRDNGYNPNAWKTDGREYDQSKSEGPISSWIDGEGLIHTWDGMHRSAILLRLGIPIVSEVFSRDPRWVKLSKSQPTLYQPYPHPDLAGRKVLRPGHERYAAVANAVSSFGAMSALVVGSCTGWGVERLAYAEMFDVHGIEPNECKFQLAELFIRLSGRGSVEQVAADKFTRYGDFEAAIGLSVYQHVATSLAKWREVCKLLAACPVHIVELPTDDAPQWHEQFREEANGLPRSVIFDELCKAGNYRLHGDVFNDPTYGNRQTIAFVRKKP